MAAPLQDVFGFGGVTVPQGTPLASDNPIIQKLIDAGIISQTSRDYSNESGIGNTTMNNVDWSQLPALGPPGVGNQYGNWISAGPDPYDLINPGMTYNDPNYGMVTPSANFKVNQKNGYDMIGPGLVAAATLGAGAAGIATLPWYVNSGLTAAKYLGGLPTGGSTPTTQTTPNMVHWTEIFGGAPGTPAAGTATAAGSNTPTPGLPDQFNAGLYGNMGSLANPPDGSAPVATGVAPDAYINSGGNYNSVVT